MKNSYLSIRNLQANLNLGELPLSPDNVMLEGVTVTASPIIKKKTDRQIILPTEMQTKAASNGVSFTEKSTTVAHPDQSDRQQHHDSRRRQCAT